MIIFVDVTLLGAILWSAIVTQPRREREAQNEINKAINSIHLSGSSSKKYTKTDVYDHRHYEVTMRYQLGNSGKRAYKVDICQRTATVEDGRKFSQLDWNFVGNERCVRIDLRSLTNPRAQYCPPACE